MSIVSSTLKEVGTLRSSITDIVSEAAEHKKKIDVEIDLIEAIIFCCKGAGGRNRSTRGRVS